MIIFVIGRALPDIKTGIIGLFEFQQARVLNGENNEVHYIFFDNRALKGKKYARRVETKVDGVAVHGFELRMPGRLPAPLFSLLKNGIYNHIIRQAIRKHGCPDVIHIHFPLLSITEKTWQMLTKIRAKSRSEHQKCNLFVTEHWSAVQNNTLTRERKELLERIYQEADGFICVGEDLKRAIVFMFGQQREVRVIPNMISDHFRSASLVPHSGFRFVSAGRLVPSKRFDLLVDAFTRAFQGNPYVSLTIVGGGDLYDAIQQQIHSLNMDKQITMTGYKLSKEVAELFCASDCYVSPSELETFCVPVAESWMVGLPCITADNSPIRVYVNQANGSTFHVNDVDSLAETMLTVYRSYKSFRHEAIRDEAIRLFSEQAVKKQILDYYAENIPSASAQSSIDIGKT